MSVHHYLPPFQFFFSCIFVCEIALYSRLVRDWNWGCGPELRHWPCRKVFWRQSFFIVLSPLLPVLCISLTTGPLCSYMS
ncbi:hypothetical protein BC826DRAFT_1040250 [Russula brevipes]|nr:hypothetical protein BC826DRAFT_1040250 [Russula brevipes]